MADEQGAGTTNTTVENKPETKAPAHEIDTDALAKRAGEAAAKAAEEISKRNAQEVSARLQHAAQIISGEKPRNQRDDLLENFASSPEKVFRAVADIAKKELREEMSAEDWRRSTQFNILSKVVQEYPQLNSKNKLALVERLSDQYERNGMSLQDSLQTACKEAVAEFNLEKVDISQQYGMPSGGAGGSSTTPQKTDAQAGMDFVQMLKDRSMATRRKTVAVAKGG
jgi:hypothetical protein